MGIDSINPTLGVKLEFDHSLKLTCSPLKMVVSKFGISKLPGAPPFSGAKSCSFQGGYISINLGFLPNKLNTVVTTWRIIPVSKWLITMVSKSPKWGYSPYKWPNSMAYKWRLLTTYKSWDDPPSMAICLQEKQVSLLVGLSRRSWGKDPFLEAKICL